MSKRLRVSERKKFKREVREGVKRWVPRPCDFGSDWEYGRYMLSLYCERGKK